MLCGGGGGGREKLLCDAWKSLACNEACSTERWLIGYLFSHRSIVSTEKDASLSYGRARETVCVLPHNQDLGDCPNI